MSNDMYYDNESNFRNLTQETSFKKDSKAVRVPFSVVSQQITESRKVEEHLFSLKTLLKALKRKLIFLQLEISEIKNCIYDKNKFEFRIRERIYTSRFELFSIPHPQQSTLNSTQPRRHSTYFEFEERGGEHRMTGRNRRVATLQKKKNFLWLSASRNTQQISAETIDPIVMSHD